MSLPVAAGVFLLLAVSQLPGATFTATAVGCAFQSNTSMTAAVEAIVTDKACTGFGGDVDTAFARSGPTGLGASAENFHTCCDTATGASGFARAATDFMITGPNGGGWVWISLNLALSGSVGGGISLDDSVRSIRIDANVFTLTAFGEYIESAGPGGTVISRLGSLVLPGDLCATVCVVPTVDVLVPTNVWLPLRLDLTASAGGGTGDHHGWADASHTLYFPLDGPVFNLPNERDYSAVIEGMNVEGNRVVRENGPGGEVPEPGTWALAGVGLVLVTVLRRKAGAPGRMRQ